MREPGQGSLTPAPRAFTLKTAVRYQLPAHAGAGLKCQAAAGWCQIDAVVRAGGVLVFNVLLTNGQRPRVLDDPVRIRRGDTGGVGYPVVCFKPPFILYQQCGQGSCRVRLGQKTFRRLNAWSGAAALASTTGTQCSMLIVFLSVHPGEVLSLYT
jgi:hypothetical protein